MRRLILIFAFSSVCIIAAFAILFGSYSKASSVQLVSAPEQYVTTLAGTLSEYAFSTGNTGLPHGVCRAGAKAGQRVLSRADTPSSSRVPVRAITSSRGMFLPSATHWRYSSREPVVRKMLIMFWASGLNPA